MDAVDNARKTPRQSRAQASVDLILEAAAQLLEKGGPAGFNTNAIAERAGVSIGTLYRYFPDKQEILLALARRERAGFQAAVQRIQGGETGGLSPDRAVIRAFLQAFAGRTRARRLAVSALLANSRPRDLVEGFETAEAFVDAEGRPLSRVAAFVLARAVHGAMRSAVMENADFLLTREFEDELVRLGRAYVAAVSLARAQ